MRVFNLKMRSVVKNGVSSLARRSLSNVAIIACIVISIMFVGCTKPGGKVTFVDYTGKMPNGSFWTVKYFAERPNYKGVEVTLIVKGFGNLQNVSDPKDVQRVSAALIEYASLSNNDSDFKESHYYYLYYSDVFKPGNFCKLTLYYLVPPNVANENLRFTFDYPDKNILINEPCNLFK